MFKINIKLLLVMISIFSSLYSVEIEKKYLYVKQNIGKIDVFHDKDGFSVKKNGKVNKVRNCFIDKNIRNISTEQLMHMLGKEKSVDNIIAGDVKVLNISLDELKLTEEFSSFEKIELNESMKKNILKSLKQTSTGYIDVNQMSDGEYVLRYKMRILGGCFSDDLVNSFSNGFEAFMIGHGIIVLTSMVISAGGPRGSGIIAFIFLEKLFGRFVNKLSKKAAKDNRIAKRIIRELSKKQKN